MCHGLSVCNVSTTLTSPRQRVTAKRHAHSYGLKGPYLSSNSFFASSSFPYFFSHRSMYSSLRWCRRAKYSGYWAFSNGCQVSNSCSKQSPCDTNLMKWNLHFSTFLSCYIIYNRHSFNGLFFRTTWTSPHQKGWTNLNFNEATDDDDMQIICTLLQQASTSSLSVYKSDALPDVKALKAVCSTLCLKKTSHLWLAITLAHMNGFWYFLAEMLPIK